MPNHGYTAYRPNAVGRSILRAAKNILIQYQAWNSPMTVRQVFYRLVAEYGYDKSEQAYGSLVNYIARSRRSYQNRIIAGVRENGREYEDVQKEVLNDDTSIPFSWIRDEKGQSVQPLEYEDADEFMEHIRRQAEEMKLERQEGQPQAIEMWCEANGMVPLMKEIAEPYGIRVSSGGGYDSVTAKHRLTQRALERVQEGRLRTVVLHVGDFDPSGEGMYETLRDDTKEMMWDQIGADHFLQFERVALTEEQVIKMNVETAPPKTMDSRRRGFIAKHPHIREYLMSDDITAQLEALTPPDLRSLIDGKIKDLVDQDILDGVLRREQEIRNEMENRLA